MLLGVLGSIAAAAGHAELHSAASDLYFESRDVRALIAAYEQAPAVRIVRGEPAARLAQVTQGLGWDLPGILGGLLPVADASRPEEPLWPWSRLEQASLSVRGIDRAPATAGAAVEFAALAVLDFSDAPSAEQAHGAAAQMLGASADPAAELVLGERRVPSSTFELAFAELSTRGWLACIDRRLVLAAGAEGLQDYARRAGDKDGGLAPAWAASDPVEELGPSRGATVVEILADVDELSDLGLGTASSFLARGALLAFVPFASAKGRWRIELRGDRFVTEGLYEPRGTVRALTSGIGAKPLPPLALALVPPDAVGAWATSVDPAWAERTAEEQLTALARRGGVAIAPAPAGVPRMADGLGEALAICTMPLQGMPPAPRFLAAIELKDAARFQAGLDAWIERARAAVPELEVARKPYRKLPLVTLSLREGPGEGTNGSRAGGADGMAALEPTSLTIVTLADRVLFASAKTAALDVIKRLQDGGGQAHALASIADRPADAFEASTFDWGGCLGKVYDLARGFAPMLAQNRGQPIDVDALPTAAQLFGPVRPTWSWSRRIGARTLTRSESSFGPETPLGLALLATVGVRAAERAATGPRPESAPAATAEPADTASEERESTQKGLRTLRTAIAVYRTQFGRAPSALDELLKRTDSFPDGFVPEGKLPSDGWGRAFVYAAAGDGATYALHSCGADGVDQHGAGDDVRLP